MSDDTENSRAARAKRSRARYQEIVDAWNRRPLSNRVGSRRFRRRLVVATYAGWLLMASVIKVMSQNSPRFPSVLSVAIVTALVPGIWFARRTYLAREVMAGDAGLDERLVQARNQAFRRAYQVLGLFVIIAGPVSWWALQSLPGSQGYINSFLIYSALIVLDLTLPTAIWAWREPDPQTSEEST